MPRIMSIDYGDARIGIALTDQMKIIASGYKTLLNDKNVLQEVIDICKEKDVDSIVIGIPFDSDSRIGTAAQKVIRFANALLEHMDVLKLAVDIYEEDERYTTIDAINSMKEIKVKRNKKKGIIDQIAAANILKSFMENRTKIKYDSKKYEIMKNQ